MELSKQAALCMERINQQKDYSPSYCNMTWDGVSCWDAAPAGQLITRHCPDYVNGLNSAKFMTRECQDDGTWKPKHGSNSTSGWTNYTHCIIDQDALMTEMSHIGRIKLMSEIGYGISLVALTVAVVIMVGSRRLRCKSNSLHINLFIAFILRAVTNFVKNELFIKDVGLEKDVIQLKDGNIQFIEEGTHWECKLITTVFMYAVGASMMWIFMEGLYLHMLVYRTFFTERHGVWIYVVIGWVSPLLYIIPWVLSRIYYENKLCWTFHEQNGLLWIVEGPIIVTVIINFFFFIDIVRVLCVRVRSHQNPHGSSQQLRKVAKFALVLIPLFGVIYIITAAYPHGVSPQADVAYLSFEMFYNSFQGFILALLFCFLNEEVQTVFRRYWCRQAFDRLASSTVVMSAGRRTKDNHLRSQRNGTKFSFTGTKTQSRHSVGSRKFHRDSDVAHCHGNDCACAQTVACAECTSHVNENAETPRFSARKVYCDTNNAAGSEMKQMTNGSKTPFETIPLTTREGQLQDDFV